jgi:acyl-[acyl-carrier-protein]-phospholipid O-acyltransferase/long-chain-fatty-acid--[acyl-carrier-protein] ligase
MKTTSIESRSIQEPANMDLSQTSDASTEGKTAARPPKPANWQRGFWSLFVTQFQGAFSDNLFKFLVVFLITGTLAEAERDNYITITLLVFSLPFILFSMAAGFLADRYPKRSVVIGTKGLEIAVMLLGTVGLWLQSLPFLIGVIFLMSVQSAFFSPSKYGLLPEMLPEEKLSWGNGILGLGTFVAIISGSATAGVLSDKLGPDRWYAGFLLIVLAGVGFATSHGILRLPPADPHKKFQLNFLDDLAKNFGKIRKDRVLTLAILGSTYFWFLGALFGEPTILLYGKDVLDLTDTQISLLRACLAIGIGLGSAAAGILSGKKIEYGLVPLGALGLAAMAGLLAIPDLTYQSVQIMLGILGFSGGFFIVPLMALVQQRPRPEEKGSIIATNSWLTSVGVMLAAGAFWILRNPLGFSPGQIFLLGSVITLAATMYAVRLVPDSLVRLMIWMLTYTFYRVRVRGRENIPERGGALFVANHLALTDAFYLVASTDRQIRFLMFQGMYEKWWIKPFARMMRVIPISSELRPREMVKSLQAATDWIKEGNVVCIFAEGQITRTGQMLPFRKGMQNILKGVDAPIIPVNLDGVWGSIFSFEKGRFYWKLPREIPFPITVSYGEPMPPDSEPHAVRQVVQELGAVAWEERKPRMRPLHRAFIRTARKKRGRFAFADATTPKMSFIGALTGSILLARRLRKSKIWDGQKNVGILLPPSVPGALVNYAAMMMGKVPVNLNYTLSGEALASCIEQCGIQNVLTSGRVLKLLKVKISVETVLLEDIAKDPTIGEKVSSLIKACLYPARLIEKSVGCEKPIQIDDLATIIFSSGSTGEPKGVMLSHYNVMSNVEQLGQVFAFEKNDAFLGVLPFFHSFGFMGTLGAPAGLGVGVGYHVNPVDAKTVGKIVAENEITFLLATPTFLQLYLRGCKPEQFGSVTFAMVGAEKLPDRLANAFEEKFGVRPMEAYGCTECSPAVTVNTRDFRAAGFKQIGGKRGAIGHPLPGLCIRIVDPETGEPLPVGQAGLMLVRGPNVMLGYLGQPEKTAEVLKDGWYATGDIAALDQDGFVTITDRLSRFSKIGGEMVPHIKIEEQLHELADSKTQTFAVAGLPDEKKGEKLVVLHTLGAEALAAALEKIGDADLPNLWKPRKDQFFSIEKMPYLGTGKLDLKGIKAMAAELAG